MIPAVWPIQEEEESIVWWRGRRPPGRDPSAPLRAGSARYHMGKGRCAAGHCDIFGLRLFSQLEENSL